MNNQNVSSTPRRMGRTASLRLKTPRLFCDSLHQSDQWPPSFPPTTKTCHQLVCCNSRRPRMHLPTKRNPTKLLVHSSHLHTTAEMRNVGTVFCYEASSMSLGCVKINCCETQFLWYIFQCLLFNEQTCTRFTRLFVRS